MLEIVGNLQTWKYEMGQTFSMLHTAVENSQPQVARLHQAQVEAQRVMKGQNDGNMQLLETLQKQVAGVLAKKDDEI